MITVGASADAALSRLITHPQFHLMRFYCVQYILYINGTADTIRNIVKSVIGKWKSWSSEWPEGLLVANT